MLLNNTSEKISPKSGHIGKCGHLILLFDDTQQGFIVMSDKTRVETQIRLLAVVLLSVRL